MNKELREFNIPFCGFYESLYSDMIDGYVESEIDYKLEEYYSHLPENIQKEISDIFYMNTCYQDCYQIIAESYVDSLNYELEYSDSSIILEFSDLTSPRYYNFETDKIYVSCSLDQIKFMYDLIIKDHKDLLESVIKDRHTSYDGFHSFYSNDLNTWLSKDITEWDSVELSTLFIVYLQTLDHFNYDNISWTLYDNVYDSCIGTLCIEPFDYVTIESEIDDLIDLWLSEQKELNPDFIEPMPKCDRTLNLL